MIFLGWLATTCFMLIIAVILEKNNKSKLIMNFELLIKRVIETYSSTIKHIFMKWGGSSYEF